jgi:hypothetical protein
MIEQMHGDKWRGHGSDAVRSTWHDAARDAIRNRLASPPDRRQRWFGNTRFLLKKGRT